MRSSLGFGLRTCVLSIALFSLAGCSNEQVTASVDEDAGMSLGRADQALQTSLCGPNASIQANAPWPMRGGCPTRAAQSSEYGPLSGDKNWEVNLGGKVTSSPVVAADGSIFVGGEANKLVKIHPTTGAILKSTNMWAPVRSSPAIGKDGFLYVGSDLARVYRVDMSTLALRWNHQTFGRVVSSPTILADGTIVVGSEDFAVYGLNPTTGARKWRYATSLRVTSSPAIDPASTTIYVGSEDLHLHALNTNGTLKWKKNLGAPVYATPAVGRDGLIYVSAGTTVYALEPGDGAIRWQRSIPLSLPSSPAIGPNGVVYVGLTFSLSHGSLYSFSADGEILWHVDFGAGVESTPIIDRVGNLYFGTKGGTVYALDSAGHELWKAEVGGEIIGSPALGKGGAVIVGSTNGRLYSLGSGAPRVAAGGDCDEDTDCEPGLLCGEEAGPRFGKADGVGVCWPPSCENKVQDPGETEIDCGGACGSCTNVCAAPCVLGEQVAPRAEAVLRFADGIFTRGSAATYQTGPHTLARAAGHELRYEDRGEGYGRLALFEGERTNRVLWSSELDRPEWYAPEGFTPMALTPDWDDAPDGLAEADRLVAAAGSRSPTQRFWAPVGPGRLSLWLKSADPSAGASETRASWVDLLGQSFAAPTTWPVTAAWQRQSLATTQTGFPVELSLSHRGGWPSGAFAGLGAADVVAWGFQLEEGNFASSYIPTRELAGLRRADRLVYDATQVPAWVRTGTWQLDVVPLYASTELDATSEYVLVAWENGSLALVGGSSPALRISAGTAQAERPLTWSAQERLTITVNAAARSIHIRGAAQGAGEWPYGAITIPAGRLAVGGKLDGTASAFARLSELRSVAAASVACAPSAGCVVCGDGAVTGDEVCDTGLDAFCGRGCSESTELPEPCGPDADCPSGQTCVREASSKFDLSYVADLCVPIVCQTNPGNTCGTPSSPCGNCDCEPSCAGKQCGDSAPGDGCGDVCETAKCDAKECGCTADWQCPADHRCLMDGGERFGCEQGAGVCAPSTCIDFPWDRSRCGTEDDECGICPVITPFCAGLSCGADENGATCPGTCEAGAVCASGRCFDLNWRDALDPLVPDPLPKSSPSDTPEVGAIPGDFRVSDSGTAEYRVPIEVTPGYGGSKPNLALRYSSTAGNGYLGVGWTVVGDGLTSIDRCPKTYADDGENSPPAFKADDALCFGATRLKRVATHPGQIEYRTVPDTHVRVVGVLAPDVIEGPAYFFVQGAQGAVQFFGRETADCDARTRAFCNHSRVYQRDGRGREPSVVMSWHTSSLANAAGNTTEVFYTAPGLCKNPAEGCATEELRPRRINYDGAGWVSFEYSKNPRPDPAEGYRGGVAHRKTTLLSKIVTGSDFGAHRSYWMAYSAPDNGPSILDSLRVCGGDADAPGALACLPPTRFSYERDPAGLGYESASLIPVPIFPNVKTYVYANAVSVGGDGRAKLLTEELRDGHHVRVLRGDWRPLGSGRPGREFLREEVDHFGDHPLDPIRLGPVRAVVDIDNDGTSEVLRTYGTAEEENNTYRRALFRYLSSGGWHVDPAYPHREWTDLIEPIFYDVDGDGNLDVLDCIDRYGHNASQWYFYRYVDAEFEPAIVFEPIDSVNGGSIPCPVSYGNRGSPTSRSYTPPQFTDADGDGVADLYYRKYDRDEVLSYSLRKIVFNYSSATRAVTASTSHVATIEGVGGIAYDYDKYFGDFNGDGLQEPLNWTNTGKSLVPWQEERPNSVCGRPVITDYDSDGRDDVLCGDQVFRAFRDSAFTVVEKIPGGLSVAEPSSRFSHDGYVLQADFDGDGSNEIVTREGENLRIWRSRATKRRLVRIEDGMANTVSISYAHNQARASDTYEHDRCVFPCASPALSYSPVAKVTIGRSDLSENTTSYKYTGYRRDAQRRGSTGFEKIVEISGSSWKTTEFSTFYNYNGSPYVPGHGGSFLYAFKPERVTELNLVEGSGLTGYDVEVWGSVKEWLWERESGDKGSPFAHAATFTRSRVEGPFAPADQSYGDLSMLTPEELGARVVPEVIRTSSVDAYGNVVQASAQWSDGVTTLEATRFDHSPQRLARWQVDVRDRSLSAWAAGRDIGVRRMAHEHDAKGQLTATTFEPSVQGWDTDMASPARAQHMSENQRIHELRTDYRRDSFGRLTSVTRSYGGEVRTQSLDYSTNWWQVHPVSSTDELGHRTILDFDRNSGQLLFARKVDGSTVQYGYDGLDRLRKIIDARGETVITLQAASAVTQPVADESPLLVDAKLRRFELGPDGSLGITVFNGRGQPVAEAANAANGVIVGREMLYDSRGNLVRATVPHEAGTAAPASTVHTHDTLGRLRSTDYPVEGNGRAVTSVAYARANDVVGELAYARDLRGASSVVARTNALGEVDADIVSLRGLSMVSIDRNGTQTAFSRGAFDLEIGSAIQDGATTLARMSKRTSVHGWVLSQSDPTSGSSSSVYNHFGELIESTNAAGTTRFVYDAAGRTVERRNADGVARWQWDCRRDEVGSCVERREEDLGKLVWAVSADGHEVEYRYDPNTKQIGREEHRLIGDSGMETMSLVYAYDQSGDLEYLVYPSTPHGQLVLRYNNQQGHTMAVSASGTDSVPINVPVWVRGPEAIGAYKTFQYGDRTVDLAGIDRRTLDVNLLATRKASANVSPESMLSGGSDAALHVRTSIGRDALRRVRSTRELAATSSTHYAYDAAGRLTSEAVVRDGSLFPIVMQSFSYDRLGNLMSKSDVGSYTYDSARPYVLTAAGNNTFQHDELGNQVFRSGALVAGGEQTLRYTASNLIRTVTAGAGALAQESRYEYAPGGMRAVSREPGRTTYHVSRVFETVVEGGARTYLHRLFVDGAPFAEVELKASGQSTRYLHLDWRRSPKLVTSGTESRQSSFDAFGAAAADNAASVGFTGHSRQAATGLVDMIGRQYDPRFGRFVSVDPIIQDTRWSQAYNPYSYVQNDPINRWDPLGLCSMDPSIEYGAIACIDPNGNPIEPTEPDLDPGRDAGMVADAMADGSTRDGLIGGSDEAGHLSLAEKLGITLLGAGEGAVMTAAIGYGLGGLSLACPLCAVALGGGMLAVSAYDLLIDGGYKDVLATGDRLLSGQGTAQDYLKVGMLLGGALRAPKVPSLFASGRQGAAAQSKLGIASGTGTGGAAGRGIKEIKVSSAAHPQTAAHMRDAQAAGHPSVLTIDRAGAPANRSASLSGYDKVPGRQLDEYPPAMFREGGAGASVRPISPADNMGAGASIGNQCRGLACGTQVRIVVE
jgi:RHS repeat-associated protein